MSFRWRRPSAAEPYTGDDVPNPEDPSQSGANNLAIGQGRQPPRARGRAGSMSSAILSSSHNLPARSYIHHAGHDTQEPLQYSSSGVRQQTAELSSSFLSDSEMAKQFDPEDEESDQSVETVRRHEPIEERSEPVTPDESREHTPMGTRVADMLSKEPPSGTNKLLPSPFPSAQGLRRQSDSVPDVVISNGDGDYATERTALLPRERLR
jgi:SulP family sulfate permease